MLLIAALLFHLAQLEPYVDQSLDEVKKAPFLNQEVEVRGYLHQNEAGEWFLSADLGVKSCCVGKGERKRREIFLLNGFSGENLRKPVLVKGFLKLDKTEKHVYVLEEK